MPRRQTPPKKLEGPDMGIKNHLQGLTGIGDTERHAAVAEAELGNLYLDIDSTQFNLFIAPVELERLAGIKGKRDKDLDASVRLIALLLDIPANTVIAAGETLPL